MLTAFELSIFALYKLHPAKLHHHRERKKHHKPKSDIHPEQNIGSNFHPYPPSPLFFLAAQHFALPQGYRHV
jgi:hypothetical protein